MRFLRPAFTLREWCQSLDTHRYSMCKLCLVLPNYLEAVLRYLVARYAVAGIGLPDNLTCSVTLEYGCCGTCCGEQQRLTQLEGVCQTFCIVSDT
jgi:hypothetical protein